MKNKENGYAENRPGTEEGSAGPFHHGAAYGQSGDGSADWRRHITEPAPLSTPLVFLAECEAEGGVFYGDAILSGGEQGRVLLVSHELSLTGAPIALLHMARSLRKLGMTPLVVSPKDGPLRETICGEGISLLILPGLFETSLIPRAAGLFAWIVTNTAGSAPVVAALNGGDTPVLWWIHEASAFYRTHLVEDLPPWIFSNVRVAAVGWYARERLLSHRPGYQVEELLYWIPDRAADSSPPFALAPAAQGKTVFALVGSIEPRKGQDILLEAMEALPHEAAGQCFFVFVGQEAHPAFTRRIQDAVEMRGDQIQWIEAIRREDMPSFYAAIDCLICASRDDPMPVVVTEACQLSVPVICSAHTGSAPLLEQYDAGLVYGEDSPGQLARCILSVLKGGEGLGRNGRALYQACFTEAAFEGRLQELLQSREASDLTPDRRRQLAKHLRDLERRTGRYDAVAAETERLKQSVEDKERHIQNLTAMLTAAETERATLSLRLAEGERERGSLVLHLAEAETGRETLASRLAEAEREQGTLASRLAEAERERDTLASRLAEAETEQRTLVSRLKNAEGERDSLDRRLKELSGTLEEEHGELAHYKEHYFAAINQREELKRQLAQAQYAYSVISNAACWKMTAPLRAVLDQLKKIPAFLLLVKGLKHLKANGFPSTWRKVRNKLRYRQEGAALTTELFTPEELARQRQDRFDRDITFSIVTPLYNTPAPFLHAMIRSVQAQTYTGWELCLADGSDDQHGEVGEICQKYARKDGRIRYRKLEENLGISGNSNACIEMATGSYISLLDHDDLLHPAALHQVMRAICEEGADFIYTDEVTFLSPDIRKITVVHCKPDFAPDNLRANNYICHFTTFSASLLKETGGFRPCYDGSQDHDLVLRLTAIAKEIVHLPMVLYYWRSHPQSVASGIGAKDYAVTAGIKAVQDSLEAGGFQATVESARALGSIYRVQYELEARPLISIIIPTCEHLEDLRKCLESIERNSTYPNYEVILVENNSSSPAVFDYYEQAQRQWKNVKVIVWKGSFNYSAINNFGVREAASGEYILLLNNDTEVITPDWMEQMLMFAQRRDVGAVGAMLYYPNDTVQHAGVIVGVGGVAAHAFQHFPRGDPGYMGRLCYPQNLSAVTAACMLIPRDVWEEAHGLDESFAVAFNDIDLCMRIRRAGYLIVWTPFAELYHYESKSRGQEDTPEKQRRFAGEVGRFQERWSQELAAGDPYYNPNLTLDRADFSLG